jgi:hypothetical protein
MRTKEALTHGGGCLLNVARPDNRTGCVVEALIKLYGVLLSCYGGSNHASALTH